MFFLKSDILFGFLMAVIAALALVIFGGIVLMTYAVLSFLDLSDGWLFALATFLVLWIGSIVFLAFDRRAIRKLMAEEYSTFLTRR